MENAIKKSGVKKRAFIEDASKFANINNQPKSSKKKINIIQYDISDDEIIDNEQILEKDENIRQETNISAKKSKATQDQEKVECSHDLSFDAWSDLSEDEENEFSSQAGFINQIKMNCSSFKFTARCINKSSLKEFINKKNNEIDFVFSIDFADKSGKIRMSGFKSSVALYDLVKINGIYVINNGEIRMADKTYNPIDNEFEIRAIPLVTSIGIAEKIEDIRNIPPIEFNFINIKNIKRNYNNKVLEVVDVIAVVTSIEQKVEIKPKASKSFWMQFATLLDKSNHNHFMAIILWKSHRFSTFKMF